MSNNKKDTGSLEYRTFSPFVDGKQVDVNDYLDMYPELKEHEDCSNMSAIELMWCWYFGSNESPFVKKFGSSTRKKARAITNYLFSQYDVYIEEKTKEELITGKISHSWYKVIDFFGTINTNIRKEAKSMVEKIYNDYNDIVNGGAEKFINKEGDIDYDKYVRITKLINAELPNLINTIEIGFGVTSRLSGNKIVDELSIYESWIKNKR